MVALDRTTPIRPAAVILIAAMLMSIGLVMVGSATASLDRSLLAPRIWTTPFGRQAIFMLIGLAIMLLTARLGIPLLASPSVRARLPKVLFVVAVALLAAALVPGLADPHRGSHRWLHLGRFGIGVGFQPSELAKLALVAFLASLPRSPSAFASPWWARKTSGQRRCWHVLPGRFFLSRVVACITCY
jgi:cell division protein FtsW (lipid II flippase)